MSTPDNIAGVFKVPDSHTEKDGVENSPARPENMWRDSVAVFTKETDKNKRYQTLAKLLDRVKVTESQSSRPVFDQNLLQDVITMAVLKQIQAEILNDLPNNSFPEGESSQDRASMQQVIKFQAELAAQMLDVIGNEYNPSNSVIRNIQADMRRSAHATKQAIQGANPAIVPKIGEWLTDAQSKQNSGKKYANVYAFVTQCQAKLTDLDSKWISAHSKGK